MRQIRIVPVVGGVVNRDLSATIAESRKMTLQNNAGNQSSPTVIVAPITSKLEKPHLPTHVVLGQSNLPKQSMVLLEQVMTIDQKLLIKEYGEIGEHDRKSVERALKVSFGLLHSKKKRRRK